MQSKKSFIKIVEGLSNRHHRLRAFSDFCECAALSIAQRMRFSKEREDRYLAVINQYELDERMKFPELFALLVEGMEDGGHDFLGESFGEMELGNARAGQFFTPYSIAKLMAQVLADNVSELAKRQRIIRVSEPACGAGCMVLALYDELKARGVDIYRQVHSTCIDVDPLAAHMAYVQLSLAGIPASVTVGNTLSMEMRETFFTPLHDLYNWSYKLEHADELNREGIPELEPEAKNEPAPVVAGQMTLF